MPPRDTAPGQLSGTLLIHGDHVIGAEVAPSISVTSSKYPSPSLMGLMFTHKTWYLSAFRAVPAGDPSGLGAMNPDRHIYARYSQSVSSRVDQVLGKINVCVCLMLTQQ